MPRYVDAEKELAEMKFAWYPQDMDTTNAIGMYERFLKNAPAEDVAPVVHAYWKYVKDHSPVYTHVCSNCGEGKVFMSSYEMRLHNEYCSRCGAKMVARNEVET